MLPRRTLLCYTGRSTVVTDRYTTLLDRVKLEIPGVRVILHKNSRCIRAIYALIRVFSKGFDSSHYTTTIGKRMYVPDDWYNRSPRLRYEVLRHELVHMRQFRRWPFRFFDLPVLRLVNFLTVSFCYLLVLPTKRTMRAKFEREAYTQTLLVRYEIYGPYTLDIAMRLTSKMARVFGGPDYFYMWSAPDARKWAAATMEAIEKGLIKNDRDRVDLLE